MVAAARCASFFHGSSRELCIDRYVSVCFFDLISVELQGLPSSDADTTNQESLD